MQILLKADVSEAGEGWSDGKIMKAFDTTDTMVYTDSQESWLRKGWMGC